MIGNFNDETVFTHELLLTITQVPKIRKAFATGLLANIKFSKTQLSELLQLWGFLFSTDTTSNPFMLPSKGCFSLIDSIKKRIKEYGC